MNQQSAQGLASLGRGPDSMLVHMAPGEVKSLQQLAMAHGGSLTINPETGLPEAGFLSSLLPMIIGAGLTAATGGAAAPWMIGLGVGGVQAARTGSLKKGLMAGLGAYGGAGLGSALAGAGGANMAAAGGVDAANLAGPAVPSIEAFNPSNVTASMGDKMLAGAQGLGSEAGRNTFMSQIGGAKGLMQSGLAAAAPMMMPTTVKQPEIKSDSNMGQRYKFDAGARTPTPTPDVPGYGDQGINFGKEQEYFNPVYTPIDDATAKKLYGFDGNDTAKKRFGFASGGPVEAMSNANSIGMNTGYPQADINTGAYATPYQQPISRNVVTGPQGTGIDPYTGQQQRIAPAPQAQFAEGGDVGGYTYDPVTQMYTKKAGEGATMVSPVGGISGASGESGSSGGNTPSMNPQTLAFLEKEENTPGERDIRMGQVSKAIEGLIGFAVPGAGLAQMARDGHLTTLLGGIANAFSPPGSQPNYGVPVDNVGTYAGMPAMGRTSYESGVGNPSEQGAGNQSGNESTGGLGTGDGGMGSGGGRSAGDARGGFYKNGKFDQRPKGMAYGGIANLGDYSDGGRLLRGPGDGISDSIPAMIGKKQPARLADGEFVVPARIVSELGNGSTEAGARKLYAMMDRVQKARKKTVGKGKVAANSRSAKYLPA